jgi:hypothetical protein
VAESLRREETGVDAATFNAANSACIGLRLNTPG